MALDKNNMAQAIQDEMQTLSSSPTAEQAQSKFADAIKQYIVDNIELEFLWTAQMAVSPFTIDPTILMEANITSFTSFVLTPPGNGGLNAWTLQMQEQMLNGAITPVKNVIDSPFDYFIITDVGLGNIPWSQLSFSFLSEYPESIVGICEQIIIRIKTMLNPINSIPATHVIGATTYVASVCQLTTIE